jgi:hypothetical protein
MCTAFSTGKTNSRELRRKSSLEVHRDLKSDAAKEGHLRRTSLFHSKKIFRNWEIASSQVQVNISTYGYIHVRILFRFPAMKPLPTFARTVPDDVIKQYKKELEKMI